MYLPTVSRAGRWILQILNWSKNFQAIHTAVEQHLARPMRDLFTGAACAEELETARRDVTQLSQAALRVARGE